MDLEKENYAEKPKKQGIMAKLMNNQIFTNLEESDSGEDHQVADRLGGLMLIYILVDYSRVTDTESFLIEI